MKDDFTKIVLFKNKFGFKISTWQEHKILIVLQL